MPAEGISCVGVETQEGSEKVSTSAGVRFIGGRPLVFPLLSSPPGFQADDTFLAPRRCDVSFGFDGVIADRGSGGSSQNEPLVVGVMAECGHLISGVWTASLVHETLFGFDGSSGKLT